MSFVIQLDLTCLAGDGSVNSSARILLVAESKMFPPGLEPGTFRVLGERDNHYTMETR